MSTADEAPPAVTRVAPLALLAAFLYVGTTAMGGGASAHIHNAIVRRRRWMSDAEFLEGVTLTQLLPGPNISNLAAYIGSRLGGPGGAVAATAGMILPGAAFILTLAGLYFALRSAAGPVVDGALRGVAAAGVGVVVSATLRVAPAGLRSRGGPVLAAAAFVLVGVLGVNLLWVLAALFPVSLVLNRPSVEAGRD